ncbi:hypothetical protein [Legionella fairfieldensis]|uniref:hypothetical protein n=1 Tax=Legionella fairfieldensis TaxID=45064 RepID=UPI00048FBD1F|nr:hypothetical protein [Legionella fairfieldensis]
MNFKAIGRAFFAVAAFLLRNWRAALVLVAVVTLFALFPASIVGALALIPGLAFLEGASAIAVAAGVTACVVAASMFFNVVNHFLQRKAEGVKAFSQEHFSKQQPQQPLVFPANDDSLDKDQAPVDENLETERDEEELIEEDQSSRDALLLNDPVPSANAQDQGVLPPPPPPHYPSPFKGVTASVAETEEENKEENKAAAVI